MHIAYSLSACGVMMSGGRVTIQGDQTFSSPWKLALEMSCHSAGSSRVTASPCRRADAVHKTKDSTPRGKVSSKHIHFLVALRPAAIFLGGQCYTV